MTTFAVIVDTQNPFLDDRILKIFGHDNCFWLNDRTWFVSTSVGTPKEVFDLISTNPETNQKDPDGAFGRMLVTLSTAYWGYHNSQLWPWLNAKGGV